MAGGERGGSVSFRKFSRGQNKTYFRTFKGVGGIFQSGTNALPCSSKRNPEYEEKEEVGKEDKKEVKEKRGRRGGGREKEEGDG